MGFKGLQENYNHVRNLINMAKSDNTVNIAELTYIVWVSKKLGMSQGELEQLTNENSSEYSAPFSREDRLKELHELINIMFVDGKIDDKEVSYLSEMTEKMGLNSEGTRLLIASLQNPENNMIDWDTINELFN